MPRKKNDLHPLCSKLRQVREMRGLSLPEAAELTGFSVIALGSYERGERTPPLARLEELYAKYGYLLTAVPTDTVRDGLPLFIASQLRDTAARIEKLTDVTGNEQAGSR